MATIHSVNVAMGLQTGGLERGAQQAIATTRRLARGVSDVSRDASRQARREAAEVRQIVLSTLSPLDRLQGRLYQLDALQRRGAIGGDTYVRTRARLQRQIGEEVQRMEATGRDARPTRQFVTGGLNFQGMVRFATAAYGATRAVSVVGEGAKLIADNLRASDTEASRLVETFDAMAAAAGRVETNVQKFGFVLGGAKSGFDAIKDYWQGNVPGGDPKAEAAAAKALEHLRKQQEVASPRFGEIKAQEDAMLRKLRNDITGEADLEKLGPRERRVREARKAFGGLAGPDDAVVAKMAREADLKEKETEKAKEREKRAEELSRRNSRRRVGDALGVVAKEQAAKRDAGERGGTTAALARGTREEYMARLRAQQQADPDKKDEQRHRREVERAIRETNKWLQKLLSATPQPGGL